MAESKKQEKKMLAREKDSIKVAKGAKPSDGQSPDREGFFLSAKTHDELSDGSRMPAAVEHNYFCCCR